MKVSYGAKVGYIRVSTVGQNTERQLSGVELDKIYTDAASGENCLRPQLRACIDFCRSGDILYVHSIDRLARSLIDLQKLVKYLTDKGVAVYFLKENLQFTGKEDPMQNLMLQLIGACAQFERSMIRERQREGIAQAKLKGKHLGRKQILQPEQIRDIKKRREQGESVKSLSKEYQVSRETIYRTFRPTP